MTHGRRICRFWFAPAAALAASLVAGVAAADAPEGDAGVTTSDAEATVERSGRLDLPHAAYLELLGKGGVYGVGYDWAFQDRLAVGGTFSYIVIDGERVLTLAPYLNAYPLVSGRSALLAQVGAMFVHVGVPSTIAGFSGTSSTGLGGQVSTGYEFRSRFLFRFLVTGVFGRGGFRPWAGFGLGGTFR